MAVKFHPLTVANIIRETDEASTIHFLTDQELKDEFRYKPGQYLTLRFIINGEECRRAYSLCSCPDNDETLAVTVKRLEGGKVSNYINDHLKKDDEVDVLPPMGNFVPELNPSNRKVYVLFGAGSGITPLMSILRTTLIREENSRIYLFFGNRNESSIIFHDHLNRLEAEYPERLTIIHALSQPKDGWSGLKGRITKDKATELLKENLPGEIMEAEYFICGPNAMMEGVQLALADMDVPEKHVHREYFTADLPSPSEIRKEVDQAREVKEREVTIILDNEEHKITVEPEETILEAAIDADLDPPFSCQMGICTTCRAKLHSGEVSMDEREGLSDEEIEEGFILTCQSHPVTPDVKVEYDL